MRGLGRRGCLYTRSAVSIETPRVQARHTHTPVDDQAVPGEKEGKGVAEAQEQA